MWLCGRRRGRCALPGDGELVDGGLFGEGKEMERLGRVRRR